MNKKPSPLSLTTFLRLAVALWLAYLLVLLAIDHLLYPRPVFPPAYYALNGLTAVLILSLVLWSRAEARLKTTFLPLIIGLMALVPVFTSNLAVLGLPPNAANRPESIMLRILPVLFVALVLTAWQYRWPVVVLFSVGINLFSLGLHVLFQRPGDAYLHAPLTISLIQAVSFLVVGYFINVLVTRLQQQQAALEQANARLVDYAGTLEELTLSRERNRLARELHDTLAHTLSALSVQMETAKAYWEMDPAAAQSMLDTALQATRAGLQETRRALKALRATPLEDLGLLLALRELAEENAARANAQLQLTLPGALPPLSPAVEQTLYRIAQEALANALHHANAQTLTVALTVEGDRLSLRIQDDGVGFETHAPTASGHFGVSGMQERAQLVGGDLRIASQPDKGTTIVFTVEAKR